MLTSRIIACLDVRDNRVVKGVQFDHLRDLGSPAKLAREYESQGADEIVVLDISATNRRQKTQLETVQQVRRAISIPLTVGGGVRILEDISRLTDAGADRVSMNTAAFQNPELIEQCAHHFGQQCTVVAIDARRRHGIENSAATMAWEVCTHAGTKRSDQDVVQWAKEAQRRGAGEVLLTSFDRDGTGQGYDCELLTAVTSELAIPVIASGGALSADDMFAGLQAGAAAVLIASVLHDGLATVMELKHQLIELGAAIRS